MPYTPSVQSSISLATTSSTSANLGATLFVTANKYFQERIRGYSSFQEVRDDSSIPTDSNAYAALRLAFSQTGASTPIYLGRRETTDVTLTPDPVSNNKDYMASFTVVDDATNTPVTTVVTVTSDSDATAAEIATAFAAQITSDVTNVTATDNTGSLTVSPDAGYDFSITGVDGFASTYVSTETAAELFSALTEEDNENWYFLATEDHTETFVLSMAAEVEATEASDYPKQYHVSVQEANSLISLPDPATDTLGKLKENNYLRTAGTWHDQADTLFPEIAMTAYMGQWVGTSTWKYAQLSGVTAAADLVTGKNLSTAKQGYIFDRNASWYGEERGVDFQHGGKTTSGEWIDVVRSKDYINDLIEVRLLNLLLNQAGGKIAFTDAGKQQVLNTVESVLKDAVDLGILSGYEGLQISPETTSFEDQANRILQTVEFIGYLAGAVHFIIVNGVLTYQTAELE